MNTIEVDLHIRSLLDTLSGLNNADILDYQLDAFQKAFEKNKKRKGWRIVFIHGEGSGRLKSKLVSALKKSYKQSDIMDASIINPFKYRVGTAIVVTIN
jgi:hypothetical protein